MKLSSGLHIFLLTTGVSCALCFQSYASRCHDVLKLSQGTVRQHSLDHGTRTQCVTPTRSAGYQKSLWENTSRPRGAWSNTALAATGSLSPVALGYMSLLALQFGLQPILTRAFAPKTISRSTIVMMQEVAKFIASALLLYTGGNWSAAFASWSVKTWTMMAGIPAGLYVVQNYCALIAYQHLTPVTFNVLNQTKTLSAALFCFLIMGRMQSKLQILALFILAMAALVLEKVVPLPWKSGLGATGGSGGDQASDREHFTSGVFPILAASGISGLAGVSGPNIDE